MTVCPGCMDDIDYRGNSTGHCSQCHYTFYGEAAFDRHLIHPRDDGKPVCVPPDQYKPGKSGDTFWIDHRNQWHYGTPMTKEEYRAKCEERSKRGMEALHGPRD